MFPRKIFKTLLEQKTDRKISFLIGPRQVGKTTLLNLLHKTLFKENNSLFLDLDIISNYEKVSSFEALINTLKLNGYEEKQKQFFFLFLDEFQRYPNFSIILKNIYDNTKNIKIYASGSSSLAIKNQIQESLAGRKLINHIFSLDFEEFLWFKQDKSALQQYENIKKLKGENLLQVTKELKMYLDEFMIFGSYPEVVLKLKPEEKIVVLDSVFDLYVKKDLVDFMQIKNILNVKKLIDILAVNHGQKIKYEELSSLTSLKITDIKNYIELLKETYLITILKPFFKNKNKELVKIPKIYFLDNGVRNYFIKNFNDLKLRNDTGILFESFIISEIIKNNFSELKFWQDKNKNEVDIIIDKISEQIPIEVKFKQSLKKEDFSGLKEFMNQYPQTKKSFLINLNLQKISGKNELLLPYDMNF